MENQELLLQCVNSAKEKKAEQIISLDLKDLSLIGDYFLIMTAKNNRQAQAIADGIAEDLKEQGINVGRMEGYNEGRWILVDLSAVIVHIFQQEEREYYSLEKLWGDAPRQSYDD